MREWKWELEGVWAVLLWGVWAVLVVWCLRCGGVGMGGGEGGNVIMRDLE